ncbi:cytochrome P450 94A2-like [Alnus glutinosa]|uniref:cytochrome P450 94A2-like n=1 Tax=Alnus glutinosa TaxID=3517 RepID=UPI002D770F2A|nr:cytochrome P450 94A2-like [Alnus glutinosa]
MLFLQLLATFFLLLLPLLSILFLTRASTPKKQSSPPPSATVSPPKSYPIIGSFLALLANKDRSLQWLSDILQVSPSATYVLHSGVGSRRVSTANPAVVQHILKTNFHNYVKGDFFNGTFKDFLGHGIFNVDGESWKFQRQVASHEFNTKSLRKFVETVVDTEISDRLIPILSSAAATGTVLDFQDILQRFAFDNICKIAFGFDPANLLPSLPQTKFAQAFDESVTISSERFRTLIPLVWKIKKLLNIGSEKRLRIAVSEVQEFSRKIIREKKHELRQKASLDSVDLLSRFLSSGHSDEKFVTDIVLSFILAGRDTTSSALTWYLWLLSKNPHVESGVLKEIKEKSEAPVFDEVKDMMYTHASLCESMRLYPPVAADSKEAVNDDVLPDGTVVKKGMRVTYIPYAMGRLETLWGSDWAEFKPERWLEKDEADNSHWRFVGRDAYTYPVFQAGPRICLGKEMAFLQMKRVLAGVLRRFKVVPAFEEGVEPEFVPQMTSKMKGGLPVRIVERDEKK